MRLRLACGEVLRLEGAQGCVVEVARGRLWITESGSPRDVFLLAGERHRIATRGLALVGAEAHAGDGLGAQIVLHSEG